MHGRLGDRYACDRPDHPDHGVRLREKLGCDLPADDYPEAGGEGCRNCRDRTGCDEPGHGRRYIGRKGKGVRTDRCPKSWAAEPLAIEAAQGYGWKQDGGGAFASFVGKHAPAVLMAAIHLYAVEASWRVQHEIENPIKKPGQEPGRILGAGDGPRLSR